MPNLRVNTFHPRVVFETDRGGEIVPPANARTTNVCIRSELELDRGEIAFHTIIKVDKARANNETEAQDLAVAWLKTELPRRFGQSTHWNFFEHTALTPDDIPSVAEEQLSHESSSAVELSPGLLRVAEEAVTHIAKVQAKLDAAKERLWVLATSNSPLGFAHTRGEARSLLQVIEGTLQASADAGGYEPHKARSAMNDYEELARRNVESNHNYQRALMSLKDFASGVTFPSTWRQRPDA